VPGKYSNERIYFLLRWGDDVLTNLLKNNQVEKPIRKKKRVLSENTLDFFFISQNFMHILHIYVNINDRCDQYHEMRMLYGKEKYNHLMLIDKEKKVSSPPLIFHGLL
jgi:hypothetical protein